MLNPKITNNTGLPEPLFHALAHDPYNGWVSPPDRISVTELIDSPQVVALRRAYRDQLQEDISDMAWKILGEAGHSVLENAAKEFPERYLCERRLKVDLDGMTISGRFDMFDRKEDTLYDFKFTSVYKVIMSDSDVAWQRQMNVYAALLSSYGFFNAETNKQEVLNVKKAKILCILKDWSKSKSEFERGYPPSPFAVIDIKLYHPQQMINWIRGRLADHKLALSTVSTQNPVMSCTDQDRWAKPTVFAVMKSPNAARSSKNCSSREEAEQFVAKKIHEGDPDFLNAFIQERKGENVRCERFCPVKDFCPQYKKFIVNDPPKEQAPKQMPGGFNTVQS